MSRTLYAVFIGINKYQPRLHLYGCINDVLDMHDFFTNLVEKNDKIDAFKPKYLLSPHADDNVPIKAAGIKKFEYPSRDNIVDAFEHFAQADPKKGDLCFLYYSGHGAFQNAPRQFWHMKSARQVETLVCADSRQFGGRDLVDKELGYLIWKTMKGKTGDGSAENPGVHFLSVMDCCHSGDNTRDTKSEVMSRDAPSNRKVTRLKEYEGFDIDKAMTASDADYYRMSDDQQKIDLSFGPHIALAAARESETAKELAIDGKRRGIFTYNLLRCLRNGGLQSSYEALIEEVGVRVKAGVKEQIPLANAIGGVNINQTFLGLALSTPSRDYIVRHDKTEGVWKLGGGMINGITNSPNGKTLINIKTEDLKNIEVTEVGLSESKLTLSEEHESKLAQDTTYRAIISQRAVPQLLIAFKERLEEEKRTAINAALENFPALKIVELSKATYLIDTLADDRLILTKKDDNFPLFLGRAGVVDFLEAVERVARWRTVIDMESPDVNLQTSPLDRSDIKVDIELIEGVPFTSQTIKNIPPTSTLENPSQVKVKFIKKDKVLPPAFRVTIRTTQKNLWVGALYLSSKFGIEQFIRPTEIQPSGEGEKFRFSFGGREFTTLPFRYDPIYHQHGITEIEQYIKIFAATEPFDLKGFTQEDQPLEKDKAVTKSAFGFDDEEVLPAWRCITIPVTLSNPHLGSDNIPLLDLKAEQSGKIAAATLIAPKGFNAKIKAASSLQVKQMVSSVEERGTLDHDSKEKLSASLLPPTSIWGSASSESAILGRSGLGSADSQLSVLEMADIEGALDVLHPLILSPAEDLADNEVIVPFGYDEEAGLYIPLGFTDDEGKVRIEQLPPPSEGQIFVEDAINERSIGRSVKMFLKKMVFQKPDRLLAIHKGENDGRPISPDELKALSGKDIILFIHGIIGDTTGQIQAYFGEEKLKDRYAAVLSFDYENLNTPIEDTGKILEEELKKAGLFDQDNPQVTIVAHSMGGLVARSFIEQGNGHKVVQKFIMCGTPNGGSETGNFRKTIFSTLSMAMNGATFLKPYLPAVSFMGKQIGKRLFLTHDQMIPESPFLKTLAQPVTDKELPPYYLLAGDTSTISLDTHPNDPFWSRIATAAATQAKNAFLEKMIFKDPSNDIAVRVLQMRKVPHLQDENIKIMACDHLSYFVDEHSWEKLTSLLE